MSRLGVAKAASSAGRAPAPIANVALVWLFFAIPISLVLWGFRSGDGIVELMTPAFEARFRRHFEDHPPGVPLRLAEFAGHAVDRVCAVPSFADVVAAARSHDIPDAGLPHGVVAENRLGLLIVGADRATFATIALHVAESDRDRESGCLAGDGLAAVITVVDGLPRTALVDLAAPDPTAQVGTTPPGR